MGSSREEDMKEQFEWVSLAELICVRCVDAYMSIRHRKCVSVQWWWWDTKTSQLRCCAGMSLFVKPKVADSNLKWQVGEAWRGLQQRWHSSSSSFFFSCLALIDTAIIMCTPSPLPPSLSSSHMQRLSSFSDLHRSAYVTAVIVLLPEQSWWQGSETASHNSRLCLARCKHGDKETSLPIILRVSTLAQTGCDSTSPLTTKQTAAVCINTPLRVPEIVWSVVLGITQWARWQQYQIH